VTTPVAFAVDTMLGRLARWLRILGHDAAYGPHLHGAGLADLARRERRVIVTRDTRLVRDPNLPPHVFVTSDRFREQLREVAAAVPLPAAEPFSRCLGCNVPLATIDRESVRERVPAYVFATQQRFWTCPRCRHVYWPATHHARMRDELAELGLGAA
jgi:uncharacterized protein with PIN domain